MGQEQIQLREGFPLYSSTVASNIATNEALREAQKPDDLQGRDVFPNEVRAQHIYAADAVFWGQMRGGALLLNDGGVTITSDPDGSGTPTTGIAMSSGIFSLVKSGETTVQLNGVTGEAFFTGTLSACSISGSSMATGSIGIGSGGVVIGNPEAGVSISANIIRCIKDGGVTVQIDGDTGIVSASKFQLAASADNSVDLTLGTNYLGTSCVIGDAESIRTIGGLVRHWGPKATAPPAGMREGDTYWNTATEVFYRYSGSEWVVEESADHLSTVAGNALSIAATAQETADGEIVGFFQATEPASGMTFGDIWIDTDKSNPLTSTCIYRYQNADGSSTAPLAWTATPTNAIGLLYLEAYKSGRAASVADAKAVVANENADSKITTFYQASAPAAKSIGDMWVDTDDGNKLYRASATGSSNWVAVRDAGATAGLAAIQPSDYVILNASKQITTINTAGITIKSAASGAGVVINSSGLFGCTDVNNPSGTKTFSISNTNGSAYFKGSIQAGTSYDVLQSSGQTPAYGSMINFVNTSSTQLARIFCYQNVLFVQGLNGLVLSGTGSGVSCGNNALTGVTSLTASGALACAAVVASGTVQVQDRATIHSLSSGVPSSGLGSTGDLCMSQGGSLYFRQSNGWRRIDNWLD